MHLISNWMYVNILSLSLWSSLSVSVQGAIGPPGPVGQKGYIGLPGPQVHVEKQWIDYFIWLLLPLISSKPHPAINEIVLISFTQGSHGPPGRPGSKGSSGSRGQKVSDFFSSSLFINVSFFSTKPSHLAFALQGQSGDPGDKGALGPPGPRGLPVTLSFFFKHCQNSAMLGIIHHHLANSEKLFCS